MYDFRDVTEVIEGISLPAEALKINGEYIEELIPGYRTLYVKGREALSPELSSYETGMRDGSVIKSSRYPARTITIGYQIIANSNEEFRQYYNELGRILNVMDAELIFDDEDDKYFIGTLQCLSDIEPGSNRVTGEFEFFCADPFKYSIEEYEAEPLDDGTFLIDYNGTYKSFPTLEASFFTEEETDGETATEMTGNGDCGFVAFFNEKEKIIQLGDPEEDDTESYPKSQTLVNQSFTASNSFGTTPKALWPRNVGVVSSDSFKQAGDVAIKASFYNTVKPAATSATLLGDTITSSGTPKVYYHVKATTSSRKKTSVTVKFTITSWLATSGAKMGKGYILVGSLYIGGKWYNVTLKSSTSSWSGKTKHSVSKTIAVSGLTASQVSITGIKFKVTRTDSKDGTAGKLTDKTCNNLPLSAYITPTAGGYYLAPSSFGSGTKWHGPSITRTIPADASGETGAKNFKVEWRQKVSIGNSDNAQNERGAIQVIVSDKNGKIIAGANVYKISAGKKARLRFYMNGKTMHTMDIDLSYNNNRFGNNSVSKKTVKSCSIIKSGSTLSFNLGGTKKTFKSSAIKDMVAAKVTIMISQYQTYTPLSFNGIYNVKFVKDNCETWRDVPNKFSANDVVEAVCKNGKVLLNDKESPEYGALGNDWEDFCLVPGVNQIGVAYSDWVEPDYAPKFKIKYKEVFL